MARDRTVQEKTEDWGAAFSTVQNAIIPSQMLEVLSIVQQIPPPTEEEGIAGFDRYLNQVNASLGIARVVAAGTRAAAVVAAMLTQSGVSRPTMDVIEGGE